MGAIKVYLKRLMEHDNYENEFLEITNDVIQSSLGSVNQSIENNNYNIGIFNYSNLSMSLRNDHGKYSDTLEPKSIFPIRRKGSIVKLTWEIQDRDSQCGVAICGEYRISPPVTLFEGLLDDDASTTDIDDQKFKFTILGYESLFSSTEVNFAEISNGQTVSEILYIILNQFNITNLLTILSGNILPSENVVIDLVESFQNTTVKKALDDLLFLSNSVLVIKDRIVYISSKESSSGTGYTFYGQASTIGIENIISISEIRLGLNKTFNLWKWDGTSLFAKDSSSISNWGVRSRDAIKFSQITNSATKQTILNSLLLEYGNPNRELDVTSPFTYDLLKIGALDQITIDYPTIFVSANNDSIPLYYVSKYGEVRYPIGQWSLTIDKNSIFKTIEIQYNLKMQTVTLKVKEI